MNHSHSYPKAITVGLAVTRSRPVAHPAMDAIGREQSGELRISQAIKATHIEAVVQRKTQAQQRRNTSMLRQPEERLLLSVTSAYVQ